MKARALGCIILLLAGARSSGESLAEADLPLPVPAPLLTRESTEMPAGPATPGPGSALEYLEGQIRENPPPLEPPRPSLVAPILGGLASAGCAVWALTPTIDRWEPEEQQGDHLLLGLGCGSLQGFLLNVGFGRSLAEALYRPPDMRAEYGNLLDLSPGERERRALQILRKRAEIAKRERVAGALLSVGVTALPAGVYYLGSAIAGPNPNVKDFGIGYVVGIALGSLPFAAVLLAAADSPEERLLARLEAGRLAGGQP
jgi:hypothetical protein